MMKWHATISSMAIIRRSSIDTFLLLDDVFTFIRSCVLCGVFIVARQADGWLCAEDFAKKTVGALSWGRKSIDLSVVNTFVKRIQERYHYSLVVLKELVKTGF